MSRKSKQSKHKKKFTASLSPVDKYLDLIGHQIFQGNYAEAVTLCERLLNYLPRHAPQCADVLAQLGTAQAMLQNFPQSYAAYTEALSLDPNNAGLWFNRGMASRFTSRFGRSLCFSPASRVTRRNVPDHTTCCHAGQPRFLPPLQTQSSP